jgi:uncharacterized protein YkwD
MNALRSGIIVIAIAVVASDCAGAEPADRVVSALLKAHNRERRLKDLEPLTLSVKLCEAARIHARDMASHQMISHTGTDGSAPGERIKRVGYGPGRTGENCAEGQWTVGEVMTGWMKSPGHRANILARYTEMGAAWARDDQGTIYWCVDFGTPRFGAPKNPVKPDEVAAAVVKQINRDRQAGRMVLLQPDPTLTRAAMTLCAGMAARDSLDMDGDPANQLEDKAIRGRDVNVKLSARVTTPQGAARALHDDNVNQMHDYREIGVGYALAKNGTPYWCAIFARPASVDRPETPVKGSAQ